MSQAAYKRLTKEYKQIRKNPPPFIDARPSDSNILDWHFVITGPPGTPYEGGQYHGRVTFPSEYPFKPPRIKMITPSGRFEVNQRICLSMSDFHEELWNPSWSVATIINGLLSFMTGNENTTGSIVTSDATKREFARRSKYYNLHSDPAFVDNFPDLAEQNRKDIAATEAAKTTKAAKTTEPAKKPATVPLETIKDPEDRIRAEQRKKARAQRDKPDGARPSMKLFVLLAIFVGILLKLKSA